MAQDRARDSRRVFQRPVTSSVKVHASLNASPFDPNGAAPDSWERQKLRGAMRSKQKLDAFGQTDEYRQSSMREEERQRAEHNHANAGDAGTWVIDGENSPKFKP